MATRILRSISTRTSVPVEPPAVEVPRHPRSRRGSGDTGTFASLSGRPGAASLASSVGPASRVNVPVKLQRAMAKLDRLHAAFKRPSEGAGFSTVGEDLIQECQIDTVSRACVAPEDIEALRDAGLRLDDALRRAAGSRAVGDPVVAARENWRDAFVRVFTAADTFNARKEDGAQRVADPTRLVFSGGGPKGQALIGAMTLYQAIGKLANVRDVAGSSVGAITAALVAFAGDFAAISKTAFMEDTNKLIFAKASEASFIPGYKEKFKVLMGKSPLARSGEGLIDYIDTTLRDSTLAALEALPQEALRLTSGQRDRLETIATRLRTGASGGPTFGDLAHLAEILPHRFKHLYVPALDLISNRNIYFGSRDDAWKDVPVSLAVRASAGLPVAFKSLQVEFAGVRMKLIDGGVRSNAPAEAFYTGREGEFIDHRRKDKGRQIDGRSSFDKENAQTLIFIYHKEGREHDKLHAPPKVATRMDKETPLRTWTSRNHRTFESDHADDASKARALAPNTVVLRHGSLKTISFWTSASERFIAQSEGTADMAQFLVQRLHQALVVTRRPEGRATAPAEGDEMHAVAE